MARCRKQLSERMSVLGRKARGHGGLRVGKRTLALKTVCAGRTAVCQHQVAGVLLLIIFCTCVPLSCRFVVCCLAVQCILLPLASTGGGNVGRVPRPVGSRAAGLPSQVRE